MRGPSQCYDEYVPLVLTIVATSTIISETFDLSESVDTVRVGPTGVVRVALT